MKWKIGHGYDVHRLTEGRPLILGGVRIPYEKGLFGHSDADVLTHAIMDAILGAMGARDIGFHFPDSDVRYAGANSLHLAEIVAQKMLDAGFRISNIDATILAQRPKLSPYLPQMATQIAAVFGIPAEDVNIKATTEEGLGFTGNGEGIAAHAVCMLYHLD